MINVFAAFLAGLLSFLSPCIFPLIPGFLAYLAGTSINEKGAKLKIFTNSVFYVLGFSSVFSLFGILLSTVFASISYQLQTWLSRIGGIVIILFGLYLARIIKIPFFEKEHSFKIKKFHSSYITSFVFGAAFAVGWSPCVGAVLGSILTLAITNPANGFILLLAYSLGLGIPFLLVGLFSSQSMHLIKKLGPYLKYFNIVVGLLLVILGILVFTQTLGRIANFGFVSGLL